MVKNRNLLIFGVMLFLVLLYLNCAAGNYRWDQNVNPGHKAGFWAGIWHGLIIIITFIISLFNHKVGIYEANNVGWPYNLGFIIGLCFSILSPWRLGKHGKRRVKDQKP